MSQVIKLDSGVLRSDLPMADGRTIRYYDSAPHARTATDTRPVEEQPGIGELRLDPLLNEWVVMAAHRQGRVFLPPKELCPLCPTRPDLLSEIPDSSYEVVVFDNRSPSLRAPQGDWALPDILGTGTDAGTAAGKCEVICFTDNHGGSFGDLSERQVRTLMEAWRDRVRELSTHSYIRHIAPFENRGEEVGVTLFHPHGQIYAYSYIPPRVEKMLDVAKAHHEKTGRVLFDDVVARELRDGDRIIARNEHWVAFVPYAARYPFEIHLAPLTPVADLASLTAEQADAFPATVPSCSMTVSTLRLVICAPTSRPKANSARVSKCFMRIAIKPPKDTKCYTSVMSLKALGLEVAPIKAVTTSDFFAFDLSSLTHTLCRGARNLGALHELPRV